MINQKKVPWEHADTLDMKFIDMDRINMYLHIHVCVPSLVPRTETNNDTKLDNNHYTEHFHTITYTRMSKMHAYLVTLADRLDLHQLITQIVYLETLLLPCRYGKVKKHTMIMQESYLLPL